MSKSFHSETQPLIPASVRLPEMTFKVIVLSIILAAVLAASDAYLALKIGTTIAASIPAAVFAMGILRFFKNSNVLESNMIQTAASAGEGVAAAMAYTLPALVVTQIWTGFPYWQTALISMVGGILGVLFSVPLRRILFGMKALRFPEGTAVGNVLRVSTTGGKHFKYLIQGIGVGGVISLAQSGFKIIADEVQAWMYLGKTVFGFGLSFEPALLAAGYIIGFDVGISFITGLVVGWVILLPALGWIYGLPHEAGSAYDAVMSLWSHDIRYVGVGVLLVGGTWTLITLIKPIFRGFQQAMTASRSKKGNPDDRLPRTERDIPLGWIIGITLALAVPTFFLVYSALINAQLNYSAYYLLFVSIITVLFIVIVGFLLSILCGYFAGLIGSTNSPLSGMIITSILLLGGLYLLLFTGQSAAEIGKLITVILVVTAIVTALPSISLENIQDLKSGQMVGATPWKQQVVLMLGVVVSSLVIAPVLNLLFNAYGMGGVFPRPDMDISQMLSAPQANLMATIAKGVLTGNVHWTMVGVGAIIAVMGIIADEIMKKHGKRLIVLGMGLAIYLPFQVTATLFLGALISYLTKRSRKERQEESQSGTLLACGLVAGNALMGVLLAIPFVVMGSSDALALVTAHFEPIAIALGIIATVGSAYWIYKTACSENAD